MATREKIEKNLRILYDEVFNNGRSDLLSTVVSESYVQHNPLFPDGPGPLLAYLKEVGSIPCQVKRMAIDGDLAFVHVRYLNWGGKEQAAVDIFRCDRSGKFKEHWDVLQPVPEKAANSNTMF